MKNIVPMIGTLLIMICVVGAGVGSYRSQFKSMEVQAPEIVPEIMTVVEYVELPPEQEQVVHKQFVTADVPQIRQAEGFINLTFEEMDLLERIAMAEAGNQDIKGKALIMNVVLNRCEKYGASIHDVIYAPCQFYTAGMCAGDDECHEALALVMDGWDESEGAIYFCSVGWNYYGEEHLFKYGDHWFSK